LWALRNPKPGPTGAFPCRCAAKSSWIHSQRKGGRAGAKQGGELLPGLDGFLSALEKRNPGEAEFHDAVREFMETVYPESSQREDLCRDAILERLVEPDRIFNVKGANLAAFERIAAAMLSLGVN